MESSFLDTCPTTKLIAKIGSKQLRPILIGSVRSQTKITRTTMKRISVVGPALGLVLLTSCASPRQDENRSAVVQQSAEARAAATSNTQEDLTQAAVYGNLSRVKALLAARVNVNATDAFGKTALMHAAQFGYLDVVQALLNAGADVNAKEDTYGTTALMLAVDYPQIVRVLLDAKADVDAKTNMGGMFRPSKGSTALMIAAQHGQIAVVNALLADGADVNASDDKGATALILASHEHGNVRVYTNVKGSSAQGFTGTEVTQAEEPFRQVIEALLAKGANVNATLNDGTTALMQASYDGHIEIVQELLNKGAQVNAKDEHGDTALMVACAGGNIKVVRALLENGADVNAKTNDGHSALDVPALSQHPDIKALLIEAGSKD